MLKVLSVVIFFLACIIFPQSTLASTNSFVSIVNPVRGEDFWDLENQQPQDAVIGQMEILKKQNVDATWLIRFDALHNSNIVQTLKDAPKNHEIGLLLEVTPSWTNAAGVNYRKSNNWHSAGSVFLTGYDQNEREKLIISAFEEFKKIFGYYPKTVGAWFIDSFSLSLMQSKYQIDGALIVADQYSTDNYQIWGQYFSTPYYPDKKNTLLPAQNIEGKIPVVITQWAARDPVNSFGKAVEESTYSVQANDYINYHGLGVNYFSSLIDLYTKQKFNQFNQIVIGLENSYPWDKYKNEYQKQLEVLSSKQKKGQFQVVTLETFNKWYKSAFPTISPAQIIIADDPLGTERKVVWFMNPYYRAGWFYYQEGSVFRDIRQYIQSTEEICYQKACDNLNFATSATRVLDDVSFSQKWVIDEGKIHNLFFNKNDDKFIITYKNEAGKDRRIEFLLRDIAVDGVITSIDGAILNATKESLNLKKIEIPAISNSRGNFEGSIVQLLLEVIKFIVYLILAILIPGFILVDRIDSSKKLNSQKIFLSFCTGIVNVTLLSYLLGYLKIWWPIYVYSLVFLILFGVKKNYLKINLKLKSFHFFILLTIILGTIYQVTPVVKSGLIYDYGMGFWGPNTHDGIWHVALINELKNGLPPQNPIFAGEILRNYHFLYDLLIATTSITSGISILDLVFRFYPILFSLLLGIGTYSLIASVFSEKLSSAKLQLALVFSLFFVYFGGSFGFVVEYLKTGSIWGGESAFWANQAISFNLNPPFAISLVLVIAVFILLTILNTKKSTLGVLVFCLIAASLAGFKAYAAILVLASLGVCAVIQLASKRNITYLILLLGSAAVSLGIYLPNFKPGNIFIFSPFWLVHSMIDFPDRVGWMRLSMARSAYLEKNQWFKFILVEGLGFAIFVVGNLGIRILSLPLFLQTKQIFKNSLYQYLLIFSAFSFLIPLFFIQQGTAWNTIQFSYYLLYIAALFSGLSLVWIYQKSAKPFNLLVIFILLILTPLGGLATWKGYIYPMPHAVITKSELEALSFLSSKPAGVILTYPYDANLKKKISEPYPLFVYDSTGYVAALSGRGVFLEDESQNEILGANYPSRRVLAKDFFASFGIGKDEFTRKNNIKYVYLNKLSNVNLEEGDKLKKIYENSEAKVYEIY